MDLPKKLQEKLDQRVESNSLRQLPRESFPIDFSSNDYLGLSANAAIFHKAHKLLIQREIIQNGATGSRLISGNHQFYHEVEELLCAFHRSEAALVFNSGYDANIGFFSSVPQRGDVILYDELAHASIRDGIKMSHAKSYKFEHNKLSDLEKKLITITSNHKASSAAVYVVTEAVFSMDGDSPDVKEMNTIIRRYGAYLILDEAHSIGVVGDSGGGLAQELSSEVFARIVTFGKALGCHGAAILGSEKLKQYLVNFSRSLIYTTGLPPHSLATILLSYQEIKESNRHHILRKNIEFFREEISRLGLKPFFISSHSSIHSCVISGNRQVQLIAKSLQDASFGVKPILSPTVPRGKERIRFCLHSYNSFEEMTHVLTVLRTFVQE